MSTLASPQTVAACERDGRGLRVAIYMNDLAGGGTERMSLTLIEALRQRGVAMSLLLHVRSGPLVSALPPDLPVLAFDTTRTLAHLAPMARYLRTENPHVLIANLDHNNVVAALAGALAGGRTRVIITQHNALSQEVVAHKSWKYRVIPMAYRAVAPLCAGIVAVSTGVADDLARVSGIARRRIDVIHNPVADAALARRAAAPATHPWFADGGPPVFVAAGRLVAQKDHATLLRGFALYRRAAPARLLILGDGPLLADSQALAAELGVASDVAFAGFVDNPLPAIRAAAAFVLSSRFEGFGNVVVEALACGTPVIATDCPHGPAEILDNGRYGRLVPVGDAAALAAAFDPDLRRHFPPAQARERAEMFSVDRAADRYLALIRKILAKDRPA